MTTTTLQPVDPAVPLARADSQLSWYDAAARRGRIGYLTIKVIQLVAGAAVPVVAGLDAPASLTGSLGALIVILEGIQQSFQFHENWLRYRQTAAALAREKSMYLARVGEYGRDNPQVLFAHRIEDISTNETTAWAAAAMKRSPAQDTPDEKEQGDTEA